MRDFENRDIARIVGVNPRTLIDWSERGLVIPDVQDAAGIGSRRRYSESNLVELAIVKTLLADGIKREIVKNLIGLLRMNIAISRKGTERHSFSLEKLPEEYGREFLIIDLNTHRSICIGGGKAPGKKEKDESLASAAKIIFSARRAYVLNVSLLKKELRQKISG